MSDDTNGQGMPPSWTPPPPGNPTPPPPPQQDPPAYHAVPDSTGGTPAPVPVARSGPNLSVSPELVLGVVAVAGVVLGLLLEVQDKVGTGVADEEGKVKLWDTMGWTWTWLAIVA